MQGIEPPYTDPYVRWCERSTSQLMASLLLDYDLRVKSCPIWLVVTTSTS